MFKIALVNMPFAALRLPSIALTQLRSVLATRFSGQVETQIHYLNHDFGEYFGRDSYERISNSAKATVTGVGDWLFRHVAFPDSEDTASTYLPRYSWLLQAEGSLLSSQEQFRRGLDRFLEELLERYPLHDCSLVGFTSMFAQNMASFALARKIKERNHDVVTVIGGANCETTMGTVIARKVEAIDYVFSGPALKTFPRLVQHLIDGERDKCDEIRGVFSKKKLSRAGAGPLEEIGEELDIDTEVPLDYEGYLGSLEQKCPGTSPSLLFETSRGCWWGERSHCTFCGLNGSTMNYRAMKPETALRQFDEMFKYYPRVSRFESVDNIMPRKYLTTVFPRVKPPGDVCLFYEVKADLKDQEIRLLSQAGVREIQPGIEALASSTLKLMRKGTTAFQNLKFLKSCLIHGVKPAWNLLVGFPGEAEEVYRKYSKDLPMLVHLPPPSGAYPVRFDRFSPYYMQAKEYGLKLRPCDFYEMVYPFPEEDLANLAYFFTDQNFENAYIATTANWIRKLEALTDHWNVRWHQRDGKLKPQLMFVSRNDSRCVLDTRSGAEVHHEIDPLAVRILDGLAEPTSRSRLAEQSPDTSTPEIDRQLEVLQERGLVFQEEDRFISLLVEDGREPLRVADPRSGGRVCDPQQPAGCNAPREVGEI